MRVHGFHDDHGKNRVKEGREGGVCRDARAEDGCVGRSDDSQNEG